MSDREAFRVLFERYQPILFRYLHYRLPDTELIHDIVQETFVRTWIRRSSLQEHLPVLPYLVSIGMNLLRDHFRHRDVEVRFQQELRQEGTPAGNDTEETVNARLLEERLRAIVNEALPERCRLIFLLSRMEGRSNKEIAALLGLSLKTVENQLTKALAILRRSIGPELGRS